MALFHNISIYMPAIKFTICFFSSSGNTYHVKDIYTRLNYSINKNKNNLSLSLVNVKEIIIFSDVSFSAYINDSVYFLYTVLLFIKLLRHRSIFQHFQIFPHFIPQPSFPTHQPEYI